MLPLQTSLKTQQISKVGQWALWYSLVLFPTLWLSIRLRTRSMSPCTGWSSASWGSTLYSQSMRAWRASVNWPENNRASSSLFCLQESTNHQQWMNRSSEALQIVRLVVDEGKIQQQMWGDASLPFDGLATNSVPPVPQFTQHVVQLLIIILKGCLVFQGPPCSSGGVIHWVFAAQSFLELLSMRNNVIKKLIPSPLEFANNSSNGLLYVSGLQWTIRDDFLSCYRWHIRQYLNLYVCFLWLIRQYSVRENKKRGQNSKACSTEIKSIQKQGQP